MRWRRSWRTTVATSTTHAEVACYCHSKRQLGWINGEQVDLRLNLSSELQFNFNEIIMLSQFPSFLVHEGVKWWEIGGKHSIEILPCHHQFQMDEATAMLGLKTKASDNLHLLWIVCLNSCKSNGCKQTWDKLLPDPPNRWPLSPCPWCQNVIKFTCGGQTHIFLVRSTTRCIWRWPIVGRGDTNNDQGHDFRSKRRGRVCSCFLIAPPPSNSPC